MASQNATPNPDAREVAEGDDDVSWASSDLTRRLIAEFDDLYGDDFARDLRAAIEEQGGA